MPLQVVPADGKVRAMPAREQAGEDGKAGWVSRQSRERGKGPVPQRGLMAAQSFLNMITSAEIKGVTKCPCVTQESGDWSPI